MSTDPSTTLDQHVASENHYAAQWAEHRKKVSQYWATMLWAFVLGGPTAMLWIFLLERLGIGEPLLALAVVAITNISPFAICDFRLRRWPCPRCGEPFYTSGSYPFADECCDCGLPKFGPVDAPDRRYDLKAH